MIRIRPAEARDVPVMLAMLEESAEAQGFPGEVVVTEGDLLEDGFGPAPRFRALIAEAAGEAAGLALYFFNYSTWVSRIGLYLEDIYVRPAFRRRGIAHQLLATLARIAVEEGCDRFQWMVYRGNTSAIRTYETFGAMAAADWLLMMVKGEALRAAARAGT
jgi:GNAT superfamily N-acetyltransferase